MGPTSHNPFMKSTDFHSTYEKTIEEEGLMETVQCFGKIMNFAFPLKLIDKCIFSYFTQEFP